MDSLIIKIKDNAHSLIFSIYLANYKHFYLYNFTLELKITFI